MMENIIFVGGPGRSGTSFVADRISRHSNVASFKDIELKIFGEFGGLLDMQSVLVNSFSPNRAETVIKHFRTMWDAVCKGGYGQPPLKAIVPAEQLDALAKSLFSRLLPAGYMERLDYGTFNNAVRIFLEGLASIALAQKPNATHFLEKTPHNCLQPQFLHELVPAAKYLHIYRNPKAIAVSLLSQSWGPSRIDHAVIWVRSYFDAWIEAKRYFERFDLPLGDFCIEDIAADTETMSEVVTQQLGLQPDKKLFSGADATKLNAWEKKLSSENYTFLDKELESLCAELGY